MSPLSRILVATAAVVALLPGGATADGVGFSPSTRTKTVEVGKTEKLDYKLELPGRVWRPLDVYLLVDTSVSMAPYLPSLRQGLTDAASRLAGHDIRLGVGEYRTTGTEDWTSGLTYRALRKVGPADSGLYRAIAALGTERSRVRQVVPGEEAHTVALDQTVTGNGYLPYVRPGQDAGFRRDARKVVVVVTDESFARDPMQPSRTSVIGTLNAARAQVVGLALDVRALDDLVALAAGTRSVVGSTVDCGWGYVPAGRPAACAVSLGAIGSTLERMLATHRGELTFSTSGTGVRRLEPTSRYVDLTNKTKIPVKLEVTCARGDAGRTHAITLTARLLGDVVATARAFVHCKHDD